MFSFLEPWDMSRCGGDKGGQTRAFGWTWVESWSCQVFVQRRPRLRSERTRVIDEFGGQSSETISSDLRIGFGDVDIREVSRCGPKHRMRKCSSQ